MKLEPPIFLPQWYLVPLLQVCRMWHEVTEKYLYRSIAIGSHMHHQSPVIEGEIRYDRVVRIQKLHRTQPKRSGQKIAENLLASLEMNTRLASLVETLWLGLETVEYAVLFKKVVARFYREWTRTNISIIQICPNVNRLEIRGFEQTMCDSLLSVLKEKSLVSFFISPRNLSDYSISVLCWTPLFDAMQNWLNLRSITALHVAKDRRTINASQVPNWCPELHDVIFKGSDPLRNKLEVFRTMCRGVTRLEIELNNESLDALCDCLCTWSSTLEYLSFHLYSYLRSPYLPLSDAFSTFIVLRELVLIDMRMDMDAISELPRLERLKGSRDIINEDLMRLSRHLRDAKKFPSLKSVAIEKAYFLTKGKEGGNLTAVLSGKLIFDGLTEVICIFYRNFLDLLYTDSSTSSVAY